MQKVMLSSKRFQVYRLYQFNPFPAEIIMEHTVPHLKKKYVLVKIKQQKENQSKQTAIAGCWYKYVYMKCTTVFRKL